MTSTTQATIDELLADLLAEFGHPHEYMMRPVQESAYNAAKEAIEEYATQKAVEELEEIFNLFGVPQCNNLHHPKKYQHTALEDCPVEHRLAQLRNQDKDKAE